MTERRRRTEWVDIPEVWRDAATKAAIAVDPNIRMRTIAETVIAVWDVVTGKPQKGCEVDR